MHQCQFCTRMLSSKGNLLNHQKTAKYCLKIQKKKIEKKYQCPGCAKSLTTKDSYARHTELCNAIDTLVEKRTVAELRAQLTSQKESYEKQLAKKDQQLQEQKDDFRQQLIKKDETIKELFSQAIDRPTTTNNKQTINLAPFNLDEAKARAIFDQSYNETYFLDGPKGLARFVNELVLKTTDGETIYACFDRSRNVFKYKDEDGRYIKDIKAKRLIEIIYPAALEHGSALAAQFMDEFSSLDSEDHDVVELARIRSDMATDSFLASRRLRDDPEPFTRELASLTS